MADGFNPMRWRCDKDGCFNEKRRPKIEAFSDCFPRRINFGDVDGIVELGGRFCLLEWKGEGGTIRTGQRILYQRFTLSMAGNIVFVVNGDAETMAVRSYSLFWRGKAVPEITATIEDVKARIRRWSGWVLGEWEAAA